jgi:hypothetical protein
MTDASKLAAVPAAEAKEAQRNLGKAGEALSWSAGFIALPWLKVRGKAEASTEVETYSIGADGALKVNPKWFASQRPDERVFELAASMMTFLLRHHDRGVALGIVDPSTGGPLEGQEHNHSLWNRARAMVVNLPLQQDAIGRAPADALFPPGDYAGALDAESLYITSQDHAPPPPGKVKGRAAPHSLRRTPVAVFSLRPAVTNKIRATTPGVGQRLRALSRVDGVRSPDDIDQPARVRSAGQQAGRGSARGRGAQAQVARTNYRQVIGAGLDVANTEASERTQNTYSRASRREGLMEGLLLPGKIGMDPSICVVIDFSGSTSFYAQKFVDHAQKVATDYPDTKIYLIAHTDRVTFESWLKPGGDPVELAEASRTSGGTDFAPAYEAARKVAPRGKFDSLCHFTDGFNFGDWPMPPARRLVVGLCGDGHGTTPLPMPAKVIPVTVDGQ